MAVIKCPRCELEFEIVEYEEAIDWEGWELVHSYGGGVEIYHKGDLCRIYSTKTRKVVVEYSKGVTSDSAKEIGNTPRPFAPHYAQR